MSRTRWSAVATALVLVAGGAAGCGVTRDPKARAIAREDVRFNLADPTTTTTTVPPSTTVVTTTSTTAAPSTTTTLPTELVLLYFVRNGRIVTEVRSLPVAAGGRVIPEKMLDQLVVGPDSSDSQTFVLPQLLNGVNGTSAGTAQVELGPAYFALPPEQQVLALGQVVLTLTDRPGIGRVQFQLADRRPADIWKGDTTVTSGEVSADDYRVLLA